MLTKILLADASPLVRKAVEAAFPSSEFEVRTTPDGAAAIRLLPEYSPAAVLVALALPEMDGYEVAAFLGSQPDYRSAALFLLRGSFETIDMSKLSLIKHDGLIQKPFDGETLSALVRAALDRKKELPSLPEDPFFEVPVRAETAAKTGDTGSLPEWTEDVEQKIRDMVRQEILRSQADMEDRARDIVSTEFKKVLVGELNSIENKR